MEEQIKQAKLDFDSKIFEATTMEQIEALRIEFLGKKGKITELMQGLKNVPSDQRRDAGIAINNLKQYV